MPYCIISVKRGEKGWETIQIGKSRRQDGAPAATRTRDPLIRNEVLYPTELRAHKRPSMMGYITAPYALKEQAVPNPEGHLPQGPQFADLLPDPASERGCNPDGDSEFHLVK